ncbi:hypothetical protein [Sulfitobacter sp. 20_GPM-1509m]|uniref:hypothetical protein n=1 Tax=Sulfitobacter sp. 20_GPM-1509m TaxID=1380367 RepID=UPI00048C2ADE|nr:hypothetical protein [Sulfitobacter sp. 20_GPM-1509m]
MKLLASAALAVILACPAYANQRGPRDDVVKRLAELFGESRQSIGVAANGVVVETFASESGSWTITATMPDGLMCLVASGEWFEVLNEPLADGEPT